MRQAGLAAALVLLLALGGLAAPAQSQDAESSEPIRWPYFETESRIDPPPGARDFGHHLATDGERILVAARDTAHLYERDGDRWVPVQAFDPDEAVLAVALADDRAVVSTAGSLHVWKPGGGGTGAWKQSQTLTGDATLGTALLARDGWLFASAPRSATLGDLGQDGSLVAYALQNGAYVHKQTLREPTDTVQRVFGTELAMRDGVLVVGAPARQLTEQVAPGAAFVYERNGNTWSLSESLLAGAGDAQSSFGARVATTGDTVVVSASTQYLDGDTNDDSGWVSFYEHDADGDWALVQEVDSDASAVAAREDAVLAVEWFWSIVGVWLHESEQLRCWRGPWCSVGFLGGWSWYDDSPVPTAMTIEDRVAAVGAPDEFVDDERTGIVLAYYDNAVPVAYPLPDEPVDDADEDGREAVTLDASRSWDPDGTIESYAWLQEGKVLSTEPFLDVDLPLGTHRYTLEVTDDLGSVGSRDFDVVVREPKLELSIDYCCAGRFWHLEPGDRVWFWSDVRDHRAGAKHWDWDFDGDGITDSTEVSPSFRFPYGGDWNVHLTVTNEAGDRLTATETIEVENGPPRADAGPVQVVEVNLAGAGTATLDGRRSTDLDGTVEQYDWLRQDPIAGSYSSTAEGATADVQVTQGVNRFQLWAVDDDGDRDIARTVVVAITPGQNTTGAPPTPELKYKVSDRTILLEDASTPGDAEVVAAMFGTNETDMAYSWGGTLMEVDGPGDHEVRMAVVDADGRIAEATFTVTVPDRPPKVDAWPLAGTIPVGEHGVFISRADDEAPDRMTWKWSLDGQQVSDHQDFGHTFTELGNHTVQLEATDDAGHAVTLDGYIEVITEEAFRERFGGLEGEEAADTDAFDGALEDPGALADDAQRLRDPDALEADDAADGDEEDDADRAPVLSANAPRIPELGGVPTWVWGLVALAVLMLLLVAVEVRRQVKRRRRRRERYEAAMQARLERQRSGKTNPPVRRG